MKYLFSKKVFLGLVVFGLILFSGGSAVNKGLAESGDEVNDREWISIGPDGGQIEVFAIDPIVSATIYAGVYGTGVSKSTDDGNIWQDINNGITNNFILSIVIDPIINSTLYIGTEDGIFKSINGGGSWQEINDGLIMNRWISALAIDSKDTSILYAGDYWHGIYKSINGGDSWKAINGGLTNTMIRAITIDPSNSSVVYAGAYNVDYNVGFYKSINGGDSWQAINDGLAGVSVQNIVINSTAPSILYINTGNNGVLKSINSGDSWRVVGAGLPDVWMNMLIINPDNPLELYIGTENEGIYRTVDGGDNWQQTAGTGLLDNNIRTLAINTVNTGVSILYAGTRHKGVYKSINNGDDWNSSSAGINNITVYAIASDDVALYAGIGKGIFKTFNNSPSWQDISSGLGGAKVNSIVINPAFTQTLYIGTSEGVFKSMDRGESWQDSSAGIGDSWVSSIVIDPITTSVLYAVTSQGIFKTANSGVDWQIIDIGFDSSEYTIPLTLAIDPVSSIIYISVSGDIFKSTDGGINWQNVNIGLSDIYIKKLFVNPVTPSILYASHDRGIIKSINSGENWQDISNGLNNSYVHDFIIDKFDPSVLYVGTGNGVFKSINGGNNWQAVPCLADKGVYSLTVDALDSSVLYAGTERDSVYKYISDSDNIENLNTPPIFFGHAHEQPPSTAMTPVDVGGSISLKATANDFEYNSYYLIICSTDSIIADQSGGENHMCGEVTFGSSALTASGNVATVIFTVADSVPSMETDEWYAFVCDNHATQADCSNSSQGSSPGNGDNSSPFYINHAPVLIGVSTTDDNKNPGNSDDPFNITALIIDDDVLGGSDLLHLHVCGSIGWTASTGCIGNQLCYGTSTSPNVACSFSISSSEADDDYEYYAYAMDQHYFAASGNYAIGTYTVQTTNCNDGVVNGGESDIDCGGPCEPCSLNFRCEESIDCLPSLYCYENICSFPPKNIDFNEIDFGSVELNMTKMISGNTIFLENDSQPTIKNETGWPMQWELEFDDMGMGSANLGWNLEYYIKIGNDTDWTIIEPYQPFNIILQPNETKSINLGVKVFNFLFQDIFSGTAIIAGYAIPVTLTRAIDGGNPPTVQVKWEMSDSYEFLSGMDDGPEAGAQFNYGTEEGRDISICAIATDSNGVEDIIGVYADVYAPEEVGGLSVSRIALTKLNKTDGYDLFCNNIRSLNSNLPTFNSANTYDDICATDGALNKEFSNVYCGNFSLPWEPGGHYRVDVSALDMSCIHSDYLSNYLDYRQSAFEPYCGDGIVNQPDEECDGETGVVEGFYCNDECILIKEEPLVVFLDTIIIRDDEIGGDCLKIGTWDYVKKTCSLTSDISAKISIVDDYIIFDGQMNKITNDSCNELVASLIYLNKVNGAMIKNLIIDDSCYYGIEAENVSNLVVERNYFEISNLNGYYSSIGIYVHGQDEEWENKGIVIRNNIFSRDDEIKSATAILADPARDIFIGTNDIGEYGYIIAKNLSGAYSIVYNQFSRQGISFSGTDNSDQGLVSGNEIYNGQIYGTDIFNSEISANLLTGDNGINGGSIRLLRISDSVVTANEIRHKKNGSLFLDSVKHVQVTNNVIENIEGTEGSVVVAGEGAYIAGNELKNLYRGIYLAGWGNHYVCDNNITNCNVGIYIYKDDDGFTNFIKENKISNSWDGIQIYSQFNNFENNIILNCSNRGVLLDGDYNFFDGDQINNCKRGIEFEYEARYNKLKNVTLDRNIQGIVFVSGSYNEIKDSYIMNSAQNSLIIPDNTYYQLYGNKLFHNNFINNKEKPYYFYSGALSELNWGTLEGGNYWSEFDTSAEGCSDGNSDGFCDNIFLFNTNTGHNKQIGDYKPYTKENGWLNNVPNQPPIISVEPETVNIQVGDDYTRVEAMAGVSASDPDGPGILPDEINVVINVAIDMPGMYSVDYSVTDNEGAVGTAVRIVIVSLVPPASTKFSIDDRVRVFDGSLNVRTTPEIATGNLIAAQPTEALGTVVGGPEEGNGYVWWRIDYDQGADGWSAEDYLEKYIEEPPAPDEFILSVGEPYCDTLAPAGPAVRLEWNGLSNVSGYELHRNGGLYTSLSTTQLNFINNILLTEGESYIYQVKAVINREIIESNQIVVDIPVGICVDALSQCSDGVDNDGDGLTDLADSMCENSWDNDESGEPRYAIVKDYSSGLLLEEPVLYELNIIQNLALALDDNGDAQDSINEYLKEFFPYFFDNPLSWAYQGAINQFTDLINFIDTIPSNEILEIVPDEHGQIYATDNSGGEWYHVAGSQMATPLLSLQSFLDDEGVVNNSSDFKIASVEYDRFEGWISKMFLRLLEYNMAGELSFIDDEDYSNGVNPDFGSSESNFNFRVKYTNQNDLAPNNNTVNIVMFGEDGLSYPMNPIGEWNYSNGVEYSFDFQYSVSELTEIPFYFEACVLNNCTRFPEGEDLNLVLTRKELKPLYVLPPDFSFTENYNGNGTAVRYLQIILNFLAVNESEQVDSIPAGQPTCWEEITEGKTIRLPKDVNVRSDTIVASYTWLGEQDKGDKAVVVSSEPREVGGYLWHNLDFLESNIDGWVALKKGEINYVGAPGCETESFGNKTKIALAKFQQQEGLLDNCIVEVGGEISVSDTEGCGIVTPAVKEHLDDYFKIAQTFRKDLLDKKERKQAILNALDPIRKDLNDANSDIKSLAYIDTKLPGFTWQLGLGLLAHETGDSFDYNNEWMRTVDNYGDYGRGLMQVTTSGLVGKSYEINYGDGCSRSNDPELCEECKQQKSFSYQCSQYYANTLLGIQNNIRDGITKLIETYNRSFDDITPDSNKTWLAEYNGTEYEIGASVMKQILAVRGYNGWGDTSDEKKCHPLDNDDYYGRNYLLNIVRSFEGVHDEFDGIEEYDNEDNLIEKLYAAHENKDSIYICSPGILNIISKDGKEVGFDKGIFKQELLNVFYDEGSGKSAEIYFPSDEIIYQVKGDQSGVYDLYIENANEIIFTARQMPLQVDEIYNYSVDYESLAEGKVRINIEIDKDGDGIIEQAFISDGELTQDEFILQTETEINCDPDTINLKKKGKWITCLVELPEGYDIGAIDGSTVSLNGVPAYLGKEGWAKVEANEGNIVDENDNGIMERMLKFDFEAFKEMLVSADEFELVLTGKTLIEGELVDLKGVDTVRVFENKN